MSEKTMQANRVDEARLVQEVQQGKMEAFGELFNRWNEPLLRYLYHTLGNGQEAEDLAQDAFLRAYQRIEQLGPPWDFKSWIYRIATNLAMDHLERERRYINVDSSDEAVDMEMPSGSLPVERQVETLEQQHQVWKSLGGLPTLYRQALILRELNGLTYEEIQVALDCSFDNARQLVHRARLRFRDEYGFKQTVMVGTTRCQVLGDLLSGYRDGELDATQRRVVEQHLQTCPECRETQNQMGMIGALLLGLPAFNPSRGWAEQVRARLRTEAGGAAGHHGGGNVVGDSFGRGGGGGASRGGGSGAGPALAGLGLGGLGLALLIGAAVFFMGHLPFPFPKGAAPASPFIVLRSTPAITAGGPQADSLVTPTETMTSLPGLTPQLLVLTSPTAAPSATATLQLPMDVTFTQNANCRRGPGNNYYLVTSFTQGTQTQTDGRNDAATWLDILVSGTQAHCWALASTTDVGAAIGGLPVLPPPPLPPAPANFAHHADCQANAKKFSVKLTWTLVPNVSGYHLYRNGNLIETLQASISTFVDSHPPLQTDLSYEIEAFNANGPSDRTQTDVPACK